MLFVPLIVCVQKVIKRQSEKFVFGIPALFNQNISLTQTLIRLLSTFCTEKNTQITHIHLKTPTF